MSLPVFDPHAYAQDRPARRPDQAGEEEQEQAEGGDEKDGLLAAIPMPTDEPLQDGVPGLPPYRREEEGGRNSAGQRRDPSLPPFVIASEPVRSEASQRLLLQQQVDQFLREL